MARKIAVQVEITREPPKYPQHEKLQEAKKEHALLSDFLEWLEAQDYYVQDQEFNYIKPESLIAGYLGIDTKELEREKLQMLKDYQELNKENDEV